MALHVFLKRNVINRKKTKPARCETCICSRDKRDCHYPVILVSNLIKSACLKRNKQTNVKWQRTETGENVHSEVSVSSSQWIWGVTALTFPGAKRLVSTVTLQSQTLSQRRRTVAHGAKKLHWQTQPTLSTLCATQLVFNSFGSEKLHRHIWLSSIIYTTMRNPYDTKK